MHSAVEQPLYDAILEKFAYMLVAIAHRLSLHVVASPSRFNSRIPLFIPLAGAPPLTLPGVFLW